MVSFHTRMLQTIICEVSAEMNGGIKMGSYAVEAKLRKSKATYSYALSITSQVPALLHISEILYLTQINDLVREFEMNWNGR